MTKDKFNYVVYQPFSNAHQSAHVAGIYKDAEAASYAAHRLLLANYPEDYDRVIIQRCEIKTAKEAKSSLKSRKETYEVTHNDY